MTELLSDNHSESPPTNDSAPFRDQRWRTKWLVCAAGFLALFYSLRFFDLSGMTPWPLAVFLGVSLAAQVFLLVFPLLTRDRQHVRRIQIPGIRRWFREFLIAAPIAFFTLLTIVALNYLIERLTGKNLNANVVERMASAPRSYLYPILLFAFLCAPFSEEIFFRGFLYNALRHRMPWVFAVLLQSLVFGFCHTFGTMHAFIAAGLGLVMTCVYEWRKTLITPILVHCCVNFIAVLGILAVMAINANRPMLGVVGEPNETACIVQEVIPGSAAFDVGIEPGDRIVSMNGQPISNFKEFNTQLVKHQPGERVALSIVRNGGLMDFDVTLKRRSDLPP